MILLLRAIGLGGGCRSSDTMPMKTPRSLGPFVVVSRYTIWRHGHNPPNILCGPWSSSNLGAGIDHGRHVCMCIEHGRPWKARVHVHRPW